MSSTTQLERYRYISPLGAGGMATVVLAEDTLLGRRVALKRLNAAGDVRALSRLRREALIGASVSHPNLVSIYDVLSDDDGDQVIVMEYVPGTTLRERLRDPNRLPVADMLGILDGVAAGLDAIHRQGIIHRDVKPANILLGSDGTVKLADLGVAAVADRTRITTDGAVIGTFSYMAPEQLRGDPASPAVDIYALATVAFEALSGRKARTESNPVALAHAISTAPPPDIRRFWPQAPAAAAELLMRAMAREPSKRPRSATELTARLRAALEPEPTEAMPPGSLPPRQRASQPPPVRYRQRRSRSWLLPAALLALIAAVVVLLALFGTGGSHSGHSASSDAPARSSHSKRVRSATRSAGAATGAAGAAAASNTPSSTTTPSAPSTAGQAAPSAAQAAPATATSGTAGAPSASSPISAVESFYSLAAAHRYASAWSLADPTFRNQLQGFRSFAAGQAGDRSITFDSARVLSQSATSATVAITTTSVRDSGTQHCGGNVQLTRSASSAGWLLHLIDINCS